MNEIDHRVFTPTGPLERFRRLPNTLAMVVFVVVASAAPPAFAEHTRQWRQATYDEFEKGTPKGVALRSDGKLVIAPRFTTLADPNSAYLWAMRVDSKGNLFAAGGSNAKVLKFDAQGNVTTIFQSGELAAQALAIDAHDNLYVGTSPDGRVYRISASGEQQTFFEPKTKYIWDLAVGGDGTLFVATGDKGEVFAVKPDGKGQLFYAGEETHIRTLAFDSHGELLAGTEPNGLILRIPKAAEDTAGKTGLIEDSARGRQAFVLYETSKREITALLSDRAGNTYAAAIGEKPRPGQSFPLPPGAAPPSTSFTAPIPSPAGSQAGISPQPSAIFLSFPPMTGTAVYRLAPDGAPSELWSSREDLVYSLALSAAGKLLLGTGNRGVVIELEGSNLFSSLVKTAAAQVTGLAQGPGGTVFLCTANPGKVFALGADEEPEGAFESQVFDTKLFSQWGRLTWWGENGWSRGGAPRIALYVRSGNTSNPGRNWSRWYGPYTGGQDERIDCPPARFVQWKAVFRGEGEKAITVKGSGLDSGGNRAEASVAPKPNISWVSLAYLPKNMAPVIDSIVVQNPGIRVQGTTPPPSGAATSQPVQLRLPPPSSQSGVFASLSSEKPSPRFEPPPQGFAQKGFQSVLWSSHDDNEDELVYRIYYRGEGENDWKLLKDRVEQKYYSWDTSTMPDGAYYLKIVASDGPSNPPEDALIAERISDRFEVDNTPPVIESLHAEPASPEIRASFEARDVGSTIARAEYSLDGGDWTIIFPAGRLTDAPKENYSLLLKNLGPGEHTLAVRVHDLFENVATAKATFTVSARR